MIKLNKIKQIQVSKKKKKETERLILQEQQKLKRTSKK